MHDDVRQMLSAYLDGELVQADDQRVRIHLEDCADCKEELRQLKTLQQAASTTRFARPTEVEMEQSEKRMSVRAPRLAGWVLLLVGAVLWVGYGIYMFITNPVELTLGEPDRGRDRHRIRAPVHLGPPTEAAGAAKGSLPGVKK